MNPNSISPEDPRLTAYALNEMEPAERTAFEQELAQDAAARQAVEEISATASLLTGALEHEAMEPVKTPAGRHDAYAKMIRFPYWKISGLAAACFAVCFIYWQRNEIAIEQRQYIEVPLAAAPEKAVEAPAPVAIAALEADTAAGERAKRDEMQSQSLDRLAKEAQTSSAREQLSAARNEMIEPATKKTGAAAAAMPALEEVRTGAPAAMAAGKSEEATIVVSPFQSTEQHKTGYAAAETLAGSRRRTDLKDMGTAATVATGQFSADRAVEAGAAGRPDSSNIRGGNQPLSPLEAKAARSSYEDVQRILNEGRRPPAEAVRLEELVNHFPYNYAPPAGNAPFSANLEVAGAPWAPTHRLVRIGLRARAPGDATEKGTRVEPGGALVTIAKAVQIQVEFNPKVVQAYRLIGYENRRPANQDSSRAQMDLGDDGLDHALTVLYEVVPVGMAMPVTDEALKYERPENPRLGSQNSNPMDMLTVEIHYKEPAGGANRQLEFPLRDRGTVFEQASDDFKFAAAVASFGMVLRDSPPKGTAILSAVAVWARDGLGNDAGGQRSEFLGLIERARQVIR